ncbi:hypothetical protein SDC9_196376 [bioreactor metagenome]|uniref:Uncharacterized protein n=1 Tax=bioreactor metagenome TaxID=1076179 RepID=A0A645IKC1_9ZZZZ
MGGIGEHGGRRRQDLALVLLARRPHVEDHPFMGPFDQHRQVAAFLPVAMGRHADPQAIHRLGVRGDQFVFQTRVQWGGRGRKSIALAVGVIHDGVFNGQRKRLQAQLIAADGQAPVDDPASGISVIRIHR